MEPPSSSYLRTIEWDMMDKRKFFPLSMLSSFTVRCTLFPLTVIKTQLQVQFRNDVYSGMIDAGCKIFKREGIGGLYRGFWISSVQIFSGSCYIYTYEGVRHLATKYGLSPASKSLLAGGCASLVGQTLIVPFDVISQHVMVLGMASQNPLGIRHSGRESKFRLTVNIGREIYKRDGFLGFYRGYLASLMAYVPNSAMWWSFYHIYQDKLHKILPEGTSYLLIQSIAGCMGGFTTTILTNPLDIIRARLQVQRLSSMREACTELWAEEHMGIFFKGLTARLVQSAAFSFSIIVGYETIKRISIQEEFRHLVKW